MAKQGLLLAVLLSHPEPVTSLSGFVHADHSVTLEWTLPSDPSVIGVTIYRDRLGSGDTVVFVLDGPVTSFTDASADPDDSYR
jgi:hypothetical protein